MRITTYGLDSSSMSMVHTVPHGVLFKGYQYQVASRCITLHHVASRCITLHHVASRCITLHHVASRCITLHHVASRCITLHHVASRCITLHHVACCESLRAGHMRMRCIIEAGLRPSECRFDSVQRSKPFETSRWSNVIKIDQFKRNSCQLPLVQIASAQFFKHIQHQNKTSLGH